MEQTECFALAATFLRMCVADFQRIGSRCDETRPAASISKRPICQRPALEVDLSQEMFRDLFGIGDAAIAGIAETVVNSADGGTDAAKHMQLTAEQAGGCSRNCRTGGMSFAKCALRLSKVYPRKLTMRKQLFKPFDAQLRAAKWETIVRVRENEQIARVSVLRRDGAIQGVFFVATDGDSAVIANVRVRYLAGKRQEAGRGRHENRAQGELSAEVRNQYVVRALAKLKSHAKIVIQNAAPAAPPVPPNAAESSNAPLKK